MTPRDVEEYRALRATIRERGTARLWVFVAGLGMWAALAVATGALATLPVATLVPLVFLAGTFEAVLALHVGVERVGRYIQVFFEEDAGWEHAAMAFGPAVPRVDPLFSGLFIAATLLNFIPALLASPLQPIEWIVLGASHLGLIVRVIAARRQAGGQRARDLARFQQLKSGG